MELFSIRIQRTFQLVSTGARKKTNIYLCRGGFFICFIGVYLLIGLFII